jgi:hypothetical protein
MPAACEPKVIAGGDAQYFWWEILDKVEDPGGHLRPWRETLEEILQEIPSDFRRETRASINAIIGLAIGREPKGAPVERIYKNALEAAQNRGGSKYWVNQVITDGRFDSYVLARSRERSEDRG